MAAKIFRINYKSDFILTMNSDAGWAIPFCIKFYTSVPSRAYFAGFDGTTYTHCSYDPSEPTKLVVQFDDHHLPIGDLNYQIAYHFTVADFPNDTEDEVINPATITTEIDGETYHVMLDFTGETAPEIEFSLPAYANEQQRISNEQQRISNEQQRIANEDARVEAEQQRVEEFTEAEQRVNAIITEGEAAVNNANAAAINANQKAAAAQTAAQNANDAATEANEAASDARSAGESAEAAGQQATVIATAAAQRADTAATAANQAAQTAQQQATGASKVNAQLSGTVITITNRDGVASSIDVMDSIQEFVDDINSVLDMINGEVI